MLTVVAPKAQPDLKDTSESDVTEGALFSHLFLFPEAALAKRKRFDENVRERSVSDSQIIIT